MNGYICGMRKSAAAAALALVVMIAAGCSKPELKPPADHKGSNAVWTYFRGNAPGATGVADEAIAPPLAVLWEYDAVYVQNVSELEELGADGEEAAAAEAAAAPDMEDGPKINMDDPVRSSPVVSNGIVVFGGQGGGVYALDAETGKEKWKFMTEDTVFASPLILDGTVYIGSMDKRMYALDLETGQNLMKYSEVGKEPGFMAGQGIKGGAATDGKNIYFGALDKKVYALDAKTLELQWEFETGHWVEAVPAVVDGVVYVGSNDGFMYAFSAETGEQMWNFETADCIYSTPVVVDGTVYFTSWDGNVYAVAAEDAALKWKTKIDDQVSASPAVSGGKVFVGSAFYNGVMVALDAATGQEVWRTHSRGGGFDAGAVVSGGVVYVGSYDMYLYAYDAETGKLLWERLMKEWVRGSVAVADNKVFVGAGNGKFLALVSAK